MYSAEFGGNSGAVINVVSKRGSNAFHSTLFEFLRNDALDARNFFSTTVDPLERNQFGFVAGGPIVLPGLPAAGVSGALRRGEQHNGASSRSAEPAAGVHRG
jgi:hypothetical protein